jgi:hypothetical protein
MKNKYCLICKIKNPPMFKYKVGSPKYGVRITCSIRCRNTYISRQNRDEKNKRQSLSKLNERNPMWKGCSVGYYALHNWVRRHKEKPERCVRCNINKAIDLANISQQYKRDINDFEWLCRKCHMSEDGRLARFMAIAYLPRHKKLLLRSLWNVHLWRERPR